MNATAYRAGQGAAVALGVGMGVSRFAVAAAGSFTDAPARDMASADHPRRVGDQRVPGRSNPARDRCHRYAVSAACTLPVRRAAAVTRWDAPSDPRQAPRGRSPILPEV